MNLVGVIKEVLGRYVLGITSSILRGARLNGSFWSESKCDFIVALSTTARDDGKVTGSFMTVYKRPSEVHQNFVSGGMIGTPTDEPKNSSGISPRSSSSSKVALRISTF